MDNFNQERADEELVARELEARNPLRVGGADGTVSYEDLLAAGKSPEEIADYFAMTQGADLS